MTDTSSDLALMVRSGLPDELKVPFENTRAKTGTPSTRSARGPPWSPLNT